MSLSQCDLLQNLLRDGKPHRTDEILRRVYKIHSKGIARISARVYDLKKRRGASITSWPDPDEPKLFFYMMTNHTQFKKL